MRVPGQVLGKPRSSQENNHTSETASLDLAEKDAGVEGYPLWRGTLQRVGELREAHKEVLQVLVSGAFLVPLAVYQAGHPLTSVLIFALELVVLYGCGSYAMSRMAAWGFGSGIGKATFYLLVLPGVTLHESAHYLACLLTGTRVGRFVPFWPKNSPEGRLRLGYVRHERRSAPITALIGLAPVILNPIGILVITVLLTPLTLTEVIDPQLEVFKERIVASGFLMDSPGVAAVWAYLAFSFALGSVPSREDLSSLPAALLLFALGVFALSFFREGSTDTLLLALAELSTRAVGIYALPVVVAATAAFLLGLWSWR